MAATENNQREPKFRSLFDLPSDFFDSCRFLFDYPLSSSTDAPSPSRLPVSDAAVLVIESTAAGEEPYTKFLEKKVKGVTQQWTCNTCKSVFESHQDQRSHFKSDLHRLNIKLSCAGKSIVKEEEFDEQGCDSFFESLEVSSISGSEDEFEKGAVTSAKTLEGTKQKLYLRLHSRDIVSVWKILILDESEKVSLDDCMPNQLRNDGNALILGENELITRLKCLLSESRDKSCLRIVLLLSGGHFAGCVFDGNSVITHKTFHRYVVRAKAGKKQSTKDATGKSAHSAGSSLRRHNEAALKKDIQDLLAAWKPYINSSSCIYIYAPSKNRQILFDGEKQHLFFHDRVTRHIPLTVRRPTLKEAKRIYHCLTQVSLESEERGILVAELNSHNGDEEAKRSHLFYESQVIQHLEDKTLPPLSDSPVESAVEHLPPDLANISSFHFENRTTPLHAAAQSGNAQLTLELLKCGCSPCVKDDRGRTPYMLAKEKEVRNIFRRFMAANLDRWDWQAAHVPSSLTKEMEESQATKQVEKDAKRKAKAKEQKKLRKAKEKAKEQLETLFGNVVTVALPHQTSVRTAPSKQLPSDIRIQSSEGTTSTAPLILPKPNTGAILKEDALATEREKRAAAAERRIEAMKNGSSTIVTDQSDSFDAKGLAKDLLCSYCKSSLVGMIPFHRMTGVPAIVSDAEDKPSSETSGSGAAMRVIVPLQGIVHGRGGLILGSLIPCALFYFLQFYLKRNRSSSPPHSPSASSDSLQELAGIPRSSSRTSLSTRGSIRPVPVSSRASAVARSGDSAYYIGLEKCSEDPYHPFSNPDGIIQLGLSENQLSLDLIEEWLTTYLQKSLLGDKQGSLSINGLATYVPFHGLMDLKIAMAGFMSQIMRGSVSFNPSQMILTAGATPAIEVLSFCLADPGNAILVPSPYYPGFDPDLKLRAGIELIPVPCRSTNKFSLSIAALEREYRQAKKRGIKLRAVLITNPSNPVGGLMHRETLYDLLDFVTEKNLHLICNEVYAGSTYGPEEFVSIAELLDADEFDKSRVHIIYGLSKDLSLPGFRVGVIYSYNENVIAVATKLTRFCSVSAPTQRLLTSMLSDAGFVDRYMRENRERLRKMSAMFIEGLRQLGVECFGSGGGFFCWADMSKFLQSYGVRGELELWETFLNVAKVNVTPGSSCHCIEPGWFRLCFTTLTECDVPVVMKRLSKALKDHKT